MGGDMNSTVSFKGRILPLGREDDQGSSLQLQGDLQHLPLPLPLRALPDLATQGSHGSATTVGFINRLWVADGWVMGSGEIIPRLGGSLGSVFINRLSAGHRVRVGADIYMTKFQEAGGPYTQWTFAGATLTNTPVFGDACIWKVYA